MNSIINENMKTDCSISLHTHWHFIKKKSIYLIKIKLNASRRNQYTSF